MPRLTALLSFAVFVAALGMLQLGFISGLINVSLMDNNVGLNCLLTILPLFFIGGMIGGGMGGWIATRFGRKGGMQLNSVIGIVCTSLLVCTKFLNMEDLCPVVLLICGLNCGLSTTLVPLYIAEIAPLQLRGCIGTANQLAITIGMLLSQVLSFERILGDSWSVLLGLAICPPVLQLLLLPICPESPCYLLFNQKREDEALLALCRLRVGDSVDAEIEEMRSAEQWAKDSSALRSPLPLKTIGIVMQLSQQWSGMNMVWHNSTTLFYVAGLLMDSAPQTPTIVMGLIMVVIMLASMRLIDRIGMRTLQLYGLGGMFVCSIFVTISSQILWFSSYLPLISVLVFVVFYAIGPATIPWMITAELFSQGPRPTAMAITMLVNWLATFIVLIGTNIVARMLGQLMFLPFSVLLAIFWILTYYHMHETKN